MINSEDIITDDLGINSDFVKAQMEELMDSIANNENLSDKEKAMLADLISKAIEAAENKVDEEIKKFEQAMGIKKDPLM